MGTIYNVYNVQHSNGKPLRIYTDKQLAIGYATVMQSLFEQNGERAEFRVIEKTTNSEGKVDFRVLTF